jgi:hypothetical protein
MTNLQELSTHEAEMMWEEYCYHNMMCDTVAMMVKYGRDKIINDIIDMYDSAEAVQND